MSNRTPVKRSNSRSLADLAPEEVKSAVDGYTKFYDAAFAIESMPHAPDKTAAFREICVRGPASRATRADTVLTHGSWAPWNCRHWHREKGSTHEQGEGST